MSVSPTGVRIDPTEVQLVTPPRRRLFAAPAPAHGRAHPTDRGTGGTVLLCAADALRPQDDLPPFPSLRPLPPCPGADVNSVPPDPRPVRQTRDRTDVRRQKRKDKRKKKSPLSSVERTRLENQAKAVGCSDPWVWYIRFEADEQGINSRSLTAAASQFRSYDIYPPPADQTPMKPCRCEQCRGYRYWPAHCVGSSGLSYDCYLAGLSEAHAEQLPGSCSKIDRGRLRKAAKYGRTYSGGI